MPSRQRTCGARFRAMNRYASRDDSTVTSARSVSAVAISSARAAGP